MAVVTNLGSLIEIVLTTILVVISLLLLLPCSFLAVECLSALTRDRAKPVKTLASQSLRLAVLIPAHNEASGIAATLRTLIPQLRSQDRVVVVADNCTDATAEVARQVGATVLERYDSTRRGKGYALDFGRQHLAADPPDLVILVDADCDMQPGALAALTQQASATNRPCQASYLMAKPPQPSLKDAVSIFAFKVKNFVRPLGLLNLGQPCLLTGTGIALPWATLSQVELASGHIVEDMKLGLDLAIAGYPPQFCPAAQVLSRLPEVEQAATHQRTRWEHGHLQVCLDYAPKLLLQAIRQRRLDLLVLFTELTILPLSLLVMLTVMVVGLDGIWAWQTQIWLPLQIITIATISLIGAVSLVWLRYGRSDLSLGQLISIPLYMLWKIPLYFKFLVKPQQDWVRTDRNTSQSKASKSITSIDSP